MSVLNFRVVDFQGCSTCFNPHDIKGSDNAGVGSQDKLSESICLLQHKGKGGEGVKRLCSKECRRSTEKPSHSHVAGTVENS